MSTSRKVYVAVTAFFSEDGRLHPKRICWEDGREYSIDKVLDVRPAAALKAGGQGERYAIRVNGRQRYLFFERSTEMSGPNLGRWFVERKID
ncbi:MAG TPA: hypothetical protein GX017_09270 [Clostridiales bacterium]|nr:hypothetical protein [Clostridiales bacterium]